MRSKRTSPVRAVDFKRLLLLFFRKDLVKTLTSLVDIKAVENNAVRMFAPTARWWPNRGESMAERREGEEYCEEKLAEFAGRLR
jgi:hypothetical protein